MSHSAAGESKINALSKPSDQALVKPILRFATCGSVDDGKSTLIGRLLYDAGAIPNDHLATLVRESRGRHGMVGPEGLDFSLLVDGLQAEREQGITIDVAYRYFSSSRRSFIVADSPGHEQYTRNMATAASNVEAAVVLIDARKGVLSQTRLHLELLALFGVRHVGVAINKMDLVGYEKSVFDKVVQDLSMATGHLGFEELVAIPLCALDGSNVARRSQTVPWYRGPMLLDWLEALETSGTFSKAAPFRMPVQWVNRAGADFRGLSGLVTSGRVAIGSEIIVSPQSYSARVDRIIVMDRDLAEAEAGQSVTIVLSQNVDIGRGSVLASSDNAPYAGDQFEGRLVWLDDAPMLPGRSYLLRIGTTIVPGTVSEIRSKLSVDAPRRCADTKSLSVNEIGECRISIDRLISYDAFAVGCGDTGGFVLIDRLTKATIGAGVIDRAVPSRQTVWQAFATDSVERAKQKGQEPVILWLTGLSGAGKSTIADVVDRMLTADGRHVYVLDGDNIRHGLNRNLGFTDEDRVENVRRTAEVARLMADAGLIVIVALISPFARERALARDIAGNFTFLEVYVDTPFSECEKRDTKGLYAQARRGQVQNFTGINSAYEPPVLPDVIVSGFGAPPDLAANAIIRHMRSRSFI